MDRYYIQSLTNVTQEVSKMVNNDKQQGVTVTQEHQVSTHTYLTVDNKPNIAFLVLLSLLFSEFFLITVQYFYHTLPQQYTTAFLLQMFAVLLGMVR